MHKTFSSITVIIVSIIVVVGATYEKTIYETYLPKVLAYAYDGALSDECASKLDTEFHLHLAFFRVHKLIEDGGCLNSLQYFPTCHHNITCITHITLYQQKNFTFPVIIVSRIFIRSFPGFPSCIQFLRTQKGELLLSSHSHPNLSVVCSS